MTGARGAAALSVVLFHFDKMPLTTISLPEWFPLLKIGYTGVDLFSILSGFVISLVHFDEFDWLEIWRLSRFLYLRIVRIYPLYALTMAFLVATMAGAVAFRVPFNSQIADFWRLPACLTLTQAWNSDGLIWNYPAWSLSAEWFMYLTFPVLAFGVHRAGRGRGTSLLMAVVVVALLSCGSRYFLEAPLMRGFSGFVLGMACFQATRLVPMTNIPFTPVVAFTAVAAVFAWDGPAGPAALLACYAAVVLACARPGDALERALACRPLEYLGQISYALYLVHAPIQMVLGRILLQHWHFGRSRIADLSVSCLFLGTTILVSHLVYRHFELPTRRRLRALIALHGAPAEAAPSAATKAT